jgi:hypothetical protein
MSLMFLKLLGAFGLVTIFVATAEVSIWAAVPLSAIRALQDTAPEAVNITAIRVDKNSATRHGNAQSVTTTDVTLTAKVDVVRRTASGLVPGSEIVVRYEVTHREPPIPGPQQDIILNPGEKAVAYLKHKDENNFTCAAMPGCLERL